jgi:hypothetical protein
LLLVDNEEMEKSYPVEVENIIFATSTIERIFKEAFKDG